MGRYLIIGAIATSLLTVILGFLNKGKLDSARAAAADFEAQVQQTKQTLTQTEGNLKAVKDDLATANAEKDQAMTQAKSAQASADEAKNKLSELENQISQKAGEIAKLQADLDAKQAELEQARSAAPTTPTFPSDDTVAKLAEQETVIAKLQADLDAARAQAQELQTEKANRMALKMRDGLQGRILAVNRAWNFVVLGLGDKNGVVNNAEMLVKRGNTLIGRVRITSVEPTTSIADIDVSSVPAGVEISPGDSVIFQSASEIN
ncbi:MAG: hypothetical protein Fur0032_01080 [Terrimicrobiaceae bacterium]